MNREIFNYWLHKLDESGLKDRMWQEWSYQRVEEFTVPDAQRLGFDTTAHPFMLLVGGISVAVISLICERIQLLINANKISPCDGDKSQDNQHWTPTKQHLMAPICLTCQRRYGIIPDLWHYCLPVCPSIKIFFKDWWSSRLQKKKFNITLHLHLGSLSST